MTQNINEIEVKLIGAFIENEDLFSKCEHLVAEKLFDGQANKMAYKIIKKLRSSGIKPDSIIVARELKKLGFAPAEIPVYTSEASYRSQPEQYVIILFEQNRIKKYLMPKLEEAHRTFSSDTGSPIDVMGELKSAINDIELVLNNVSSEKGIGEIVDQAINEILEMKDTPTRSAYSTSLKKLDEITGGLLPGIFVIGALPGMGKTSFLINMIVHNGIKGDVPVVFFSQEMAATQIVKNIFSNLYDINTAAIRDGDVDEDQIINIKSAKQRIKDNIIIDDTAGVTWQYIDAKLTSVRKRIPIETQLIVMVDYLQIMTNTDDETKGKSDEAQMGARCKGLMNMWKKHNACIIELSQLGREVAKEKRQPRMSDGLGSGAIEANANVFTLLHRPDYFEIAPTDDKGNSLKGLVKIIVDKNRGGRKGSAFARFEGRYSKFVDFDESEWTGGIN